MWYGRFKKFGIRYDTMKICGIDEAGRGCIVGPLVICGAMIDEKKQASLKTMGVKDSKLLTPRKREQLAHELPNHVEYQLIIVPAAEVDANVLSDGKTNLNWLEAEKSVELINMMNPDAAILDSPSPNLKAYKEYVTERLLAKKVKLLVEHKADLHHPIVAAASVLAKVARDAAIAKIKQEVGEDFGSGYMSDPRTSAFLKKNWKKYASVFRHSWAPYRQLAGMNTQKKLGNY